MALNTNEQLTLAEAAIAINNGPAEVAEEVVEESTEETTEISEMDMVALSFIQSALGEDIINVRLVARLQPKRGVHPEARRLRVAELEDLELVAALAVDGVVERDRAVDGARHE